jgi:hypothetical protein
MGTNRNNPDEGRIFVWIKRGWFERIKESPGGVAFTPIAGSEDELIEYISRDDPPVELVELDARYRKKVAEEFSERSQSYREAPEDWREEASNEDENQEYHQHD